MRVDLFNLLSAKLRKWPNTLKQFVGNLPTNCLSVFGHFVGLVLKGLTEYGRFYTLNQISGKNTKRMVLLKFT